MTGERCRLEELVDLPDLLFPHLKGHSALVVGR